MFMLPEVVVPDAMSVCIVGDLSKWDPNATPMQKQKNGDSTI